MSGLAAEHLPGVIGHELRNPLASALTGAMLLREMVDDQDPRAAVADGVLRDLDRMTNLIDGWLSLARGAATCGARAIDVESLLVNVAANARAEMVSAPPSVTVEGNQSLLERVLENLCENARNAGASNIRIAAQCDERQVILHVEDDGSGVDEGDVDRVFDAGWSAQGGTGLGLHAVVTTVHAMSGEVRCVPLPRGTRFSITLPRCTHSSR
ncbi:MAG: sensor histidine kinase [Planctomycetota bacterium]